MNKLETSLIKGVHDAGRAYNKLTNWALPHAPESFVQIYVTMAVGKLGHFVYPDISIGKIRREIGLEITSKSQEILNYRPDISVWMKSGKGLRAIIEIKRTRRFANIKKDIDKIDRINNLTNDQTTGYIIGYAKVKARGRQLEDVFAGWAQSADCRLIGGNLFDDWGFCLLRIN